VRVSQWSNVARQLLAEVSDAELLARYVKQREDNAFTHLVARYSRLVWMQCRKLLPADADADDAFQATFLTLARSAGKLPADMPLGPWLYGVAYRVCQNARRAMVRRTRRELDCARPEAVRPVADSTWEAAFSAVGEEVQRLGAGLRVAFVLCCIEGRSSAEAAAILGVTPGALATRLSRAKQALLDRLARRGIGTGILPLSFLTNEGAAPAEVINRTLTLVTSGVTVPGSIQSLTHGVIGLTMTRYKLLAAGVLTISGLGLGTGVWYSVMAAQPPESQEPSKQQVVLAFQEKPADKNKPQHVEEKKADPIALMKMMDGFRNKLPPPQGLNEMNGEGTPDVDGEVHPDSHLFGVAKRMGVSTKTECMILLTYLKDRQVKIRHIAAFALEDIVKAHPHGFPAGALDELDSDEHRKLVQAFVAGIEKLTIQEKEKEDKE
jgi:RNA polymerase sigma factor (sigma-70 family)